jgi:hypothetical protein
LAFGVRVSVSWTDAAQALPILDHAKKLDLLATRICVGRQRRQLS